MQGGEGEAPCTKILKGSRKHSNWECSLFYSFLASGSEEEYQDQPLSSVPCMMRI